MNSRGGDTREKLLEGALKCLAEHGIAGTSARTVAAAAGVNQALVFYHFGNVHDLLIAACQHGTEQHVARYRDRFSRVSTIDELLEVGRELQATEGSSGNVTFLAQLLAGAQVDPRLAPATAAGLALWITEIEQVLDRVLATSPLNEFIDIPGLARSVAAAFIGFLLYDGVDPDGGRRSLSALEQLASLVTVLDNQGPLVRRAIRTGIRRGDRRNRASEPSSEPNSEPSSERGSELSSEFSRED